MRGKCPLPAVRNVPPVPRSRPALGGERAFPGDACRGGVRPKRASTEVPNRTSRWWKAAIRLRGSKGKARPPARRQIHRMDTWGGLDDDTQRPSGNVTMDVGDWLRGLGLGQYEAVFLENDIDADVLPELTEADFEKVGVSLGHRKRLLKAIAGLGAPVATASLPAAGQDAALSTAKPSEASAPAATESAERRHLAVMFCDLVGSTSMSAALDAEDWRDLVGGYLDAASEAVRQMGGHVAKKLGDGIMALFGHPIAQENDAERAVRAALAIQLALAELNRKNLGSVRPELVARIGIAAGAVVVDSSGEIFGDAPNIAARVQALAEPGTVLVTARVQRQVAGLFVVEDRGAHALKGVAEPTALFRIARASGGGRRSGQRALTPLVGRDEEVTMLLRRWERARQGEGQFVTIVGER